MYEFLISIRREIIWFDEEVFLINLMGLVMFWNYLFWIDSSWNGIYCVDWEIGGNVENVMLNLYYLVLVYVYDNSVIVFLGMNYNLIINIVKSWGNVWVWWFIGLLGCCW